MPENSERGFPHLPQTSGEFAALAGFNPVEGDNPHSPDRHFTDKQRATMGSLNSITLSLGFAIGSVAVGYVADIFGPAKTLLGAQILLLPVLLLYWKMFKHEKMLN